MSFDLEMQRALEADGEKLRQLTGVDHGPFFEFGKYEPEAPCPYCFESSGYHARIHPATWYEPSWADADPTRPCEECGGTGSVPCDEAMYEDERADEFNDPGYEAALDAQAGAS